MDYISIASKYGIFFKHYITKYQYSILYTYMYVLIYIHICIISFKTSHPNGDLF